MNSYQITIRDFFEHILLEKISYETFEILQKRISDAILDNDNGLSEFCEYFGLNGEAFERIEISDFPFNKWWNEYCKQIQAEIKENAYEEEAFYQDYSRITGSR